MLIISTCSPQQHLSFTPARQYLQLPSFQFRCRLSGKPAVNASGLKLTSDDSKLFKELDAEEQVDTTMDF
jgi:hypothetical protein